MRAPRLRAVTIAATDVTGAGAFLGAVCGVAAVSDADHVLVPIDDVVLRIGAPSAPGRVGITAVEVETGTDEQTHGRLNGIDVTTAPADMSPARTDGDTILDHVAVAVDDLEGAARQWEAATGATAELIGVHPASNGSLLAARLILGDRMVELLSPVPNVDSAIASRLRRHGEGPIAIALPAKSLEAKREQLEQLGVRMLWNAPHWLVHPANPANVLIQLTPRVRH